MIGNEERREVPMRHVIIFAMVKNGMIQLEDRKRDGDMYRGLVMVPGGKIYPHEMPEEALRREILEEYGVMPTEYKFIGTLDEPDSMGMPYHREIYLVTDWNGTVSNPEGFNEHLEVPLSRARQLCNHPTSQKILDIVTASLPKPDIRTPPARTALPSWNPAF